MRFAISDHIRQVHFPPISEVKGWLAEAPADRPLIDLCQAVPDYAPAREMSDYLAAAIHDPMISKYSPDEGLVEVRESVCARSRRVYGAGPGLNEVCLTIGASQALWLALMVLCQEGDEVVVQLPAYFDHPMALTMLGIRSVFAPFDEGNRGLPSPAVIEALITPRTKAILLVTPSNPTGAVTPPAVIHELYQVARRHGIALMLDETYADFIPGGPAPHQLFSDPDWSDHFVQIMSFGKTYALTGYRAGMLIASAKFIHHALKVQDTMAVCQPRITQLAVKFGADYLDGWVADNRDMMERRHDCFVQEFCRPGNPFTLAASGTFFGWVRHPYVGMTGREVARLLIREAGLLCLPGEVFGPGLEGYLRLAFGNIREELVPEAAARFRELGSGLS